METNGRIDVINGRIDGFIGIDKIYVGRASKSNKLLGSPLSNPFFITKDRPRKMVINLYKKWILAEYAKGEGAAYEELQRLAKLVREGNDLKLTCWCAPQACHADIIKQVVEFINARSRHEEVL